MEITVRVRIPEGTNRKIISELAEIFTRAQALKSLAGGRREMRRETASWRELREYLEEYRDLGGQ
ncbi:hypothetical protein [Thermococcus thioreducens]|uniref:Uncharacterized protein n=1 Tax=Thermococcus thioreducens TaxID=277988 RepID=A0A0Q2M4N2_9EURY|nr:hypothetical protein [Thermococcus thioreducens]ASJ13164.1 hypothetical protein A3L14_09815 [Thermococcus thioreducens]KQH82882.1 hypothetical protein AMR53_03435 [Thermococcus thioreducens]SEW20346.1 hypothetical protein SAMN05216170_2062 [Thermococcus thioreducens]